MIEQFGFPFRRWDRERGDFGFSETDHTDPILDWVDDSRVHHPIGGVTVCPGWTLMFDHVIKPRSVSFLRVFFTKTSDEWRRDQISDDVTGGALAGTAVTDLAGAPLELNEIVIFDSMTRRLFELSNEAFRMLPRRQREWLERSREFFLSEEMERDVR